MENIIKIIMERDDMTYEEAKEWVEEVRDMILEDVDNGVEILLNELGLEMDYIFDLI